MHVLLMLLRHIPHVLSRILPGWFVFNYGFAWFQFVRKNKRFPRNYSHKSSRVNDYFFFTMIRRPSFLKEVCTDKEYSKIFAKGICTSLEIAQTIAVIDLDACQNFKGFSRAIIPYQDKPFIAKPTHSSGSVLYLDEPMDREKLKAFYAVAEKNYFFRFRETQYARLKKKILIEENIGSTTHINPLNDYKFYCSRGEILFCEVHVNRFTDHRWNYYSTPEFRKIDTEPASPILKEKVKEPRGWKKMLQYASELSKQFDFVRIDLYDVRGKIHFGEFTFSPGAAIGEFMDDEFACAMMRRIETVIRTQKKNEMPIRI
jgi:TupA-like ATPgrasp